MGYGKGRENKKDTCTIYRGVSKHSHINVHGALR